MEKYYPPKHQQKEFHCIHCGVYSAQRWGVFEWRNPGYSPNDKEDLTFSICLHCKKWCYWHNGKMVVPSEAPVSPAHQDMPSECIDEYNEARDIVARSPRAAAALLRLAIQKLLPVLGVDDKNINNSIGKLVQSGLPLQVQQALDYCRVVGNNAVHPGEIDINDTPEIAHNLFNMINFIVEDRISRPKHIQALYDKLPEGAREAIESRDK